MTRFVAVGVGLVVVFVLMLVVLTTGWPAGEVM
jgi:hypothetical protein